MPDELHVTRAPDPLEHIRAGVDAHRKVNEAAKQAAAEQPVPPPPPAPPEPEPPQ